MRCVIYTHNYDTACAIIASDWPRGGAPPNILSGLRRVSKSSRGLAETENVTAFICITALWTRQHVIATQRSSIDFLLKHEIFMQNNATLESYIISLWRPLSLPARGIGIQYFLCVLSWISASPFHRRPDWSSAETRMYRTYNISAMLVIIDLLWVRDYFKWVSKWNLYTHNIRRYIGPAGPWVWRLNSSVVVLSTTLNSCGAIEEMILWVLLQSALLQSAPLHSWFSFLVVPDLLCS